MLVVNDLLTFNWATCLPQALAMETFPLVMIGAQGCRKLMSPLRIVGFSKPPWDKLKSSSSWIVQDLMLTNLLPCCCSPLISQLYKLLIRFESSNESSSNWSFDRMFESILMRFFLVQMSALTIKYFWLKGKTRSLSIAGFPSLAWREHKLHI